MSEEEIKRGRGRPPKKKNQDWVSNVKTETAFKPSREETETTEISDGDSGIPIPHFVKGGKPSIKLTVLAVSPGPYTTQAATWNAIFEFQTINLERTRLGLTQLKDKDIRERMKMSPLEIQHVMLDEGYKKFRVSKSATMVQQTIADIAPAVRTTITEFMNQLRAIGKCEVCGRMAQDDIKKMREGLEFVVDCMNKFGLPKVDTAYAENNDELDTTQAIMRGVALIEEAKTWPNLAPQRVVQHFLEGDSGSTDTRSKGKNNRVDENKGALPGNADVRPDETLHPVSVPGTVLQEQEKVYSNDIQQPPGEEPGASSGHNPVLTGETSDRQDSEERN